MPAAIPGDGRRRTSGTRLSALDSQLLTKRPDQRELRIIFSWMNKRLRLQTSNRVQTLFEWRHDGRHGIGHHVWVRSKIKQKSALGTNVFCLGRPKNRCFELSAGDSRPPLSVEQWLILSEPGDIAIRHAGNKRVAAPARYLFAYAAGPLRKRRCHHPVIAFIRWRSADDVVHVHRPDAGLARDICQRTPGGVGEVGAVLHGIGNVRLRRELE